MCQWIAICISDSIASAFSNVKGKHCSYYIQFAIENTIGMDFAPSVKISDTILGHIFMGPK